MKRHYFIANNVKYLELVEKELIAAGIPENQVHTLSENEAEMEIHQLHPVADFMKTDVIRRGLQGLMIGLLGSALILAVAAMFGWWQAVGWTPFVFLAVAVLGFCTWEGGFLGFQQQNKHFSRFQMDLRSDKHVLFVDVTPDQEMLMVDVLDTYPRLQPAGSGEAAPEWLMRSQRQFKNFVRWAP